MSKSFAGSCQCGAVSFRILGEFDSFFLCHCKRCRKDSGSAHSANLFSKSAEITWEKGEDKVKPFQIPGTHHEKSFCSECGSALPSVQMDGSLLVVPAGCLDSPIDIPPNAHICCSSRAEWDDGLDRVQELDGLPR